MTVSVTAEYSHPLEFIISSVIPTSMGVKLLGSRSHYFTYIIWYIIDNYIHYLMTGLLFVLWKQLMALADMNFHGVHIDYYLSVV